MESFKSNRGSFFGIIVPGAFLCINLYFVYYKYINKLVVDSLGSLPGETNDETFLLATMFFVISYVFGMTLRLLKPSIIEYIAAPLKSIVAPFEVGFRHIGRKDKSKEYKDSLTTEFYFIWETYPYSTWFIKTYCNEAGASYKEFYDNILENEYDGNDALLNLSFINHCKVYVLEHSEKLSEEVLYNEGISRFISGVIYSLLIILISIILNLESSFYPLIWVYSSILILFLFRFRKLRVKEALTILDGNAFLKSKENNNPKRKKKKRKKNK